MNTDDVLVIEKQLEIDQKTDLISKQKKPTLSEAQLELKAQVLVEKFFRAKDELKDIKNALKAYKVSSEKMEELKKARKEFTQQITDEKDRIEAEFQKDKIYNELREKVLDQEEKIAVAKQDLRIILKEKAMENEFVEIKFEVNGQPFKLQTQAKVAIYFNGKEEK
ncbi:MAG: hypothetical protein Q8O95_06365 [bacterium]|nr:hypothetical protein [bacterium]